ncbi:MAG: hypothetical protein ACK4L7_02820 [Flavobacteriales bacterium]
MRPLTLLLAAVLCGGLQAQTVHFNGWGGYTFRDRFPIYTTLVPLDATIQDAFSFGGGVEYRPVINTGMELYYFGMPTVGQVRGALGARYSESLMVSYIMAGGLRYTSLGGAARGYGGLSLGIALFDGETVYRSYAAWGLRGGVLIQANERLGLKLGAQLHSPIQAVGGGLYVGTGGVGGGIETYSTIYQFGFTGGLCFTLNGGQ